MFEFRVIGRVTVVGGSIMSTMIYVHSDKTRWKKSRSDASVGGRSIVCTSGVLFLITIAGIAVRHNNIETKYINPGEGVSFVIGIYNVVFHIYEP